MDGGQLCYSIVITTGISPATSTSAGFPTYTPCIWPNTR